MLSLDLLFSFTSTYLNLIDQREQSSLPILKRVQAGISQIRMMRGAKLQPRTLARSSNPCPFPPAKKGWSSGQLQRIFWVGITTARIRSLIQPSDRFGLGRHSSRESWYPNYDPDRNPSAIRLAQGRTSSLAVQAVVSAQCQLSSTTTKQEGPKWGRSPRPGL